MKLKRTQRRKERPKTAAFRLYKEDRVRLKKMARKEKVSISEAVRRSITDRHFRLCTEAGDKVN